MKFEAVYHRVSDNMCYPLNEDELQINIKTGYDIKKVFLHYGDPFSAGILGGSEKWQAKRIQVKQTKKLKHHLWWSITVKPEFKRCRYYFEIFDGSETWYFFEDGFLSEEQINISGRNLQCFTLPWMNKADINTSVDWVKDTVWYQIFPDRFCNGDSSLNSKDTREWKMEEAKNHYQYGGDLAGIISKLDYLENLGITGIYLTPVFHGSSIHKYDTIDYMKIDPQFGDNKAFKELVDEAHNRGIRIMIDGVFNHSGNKFAPWLDVLENGPESQYYDWFMVNEWPFDQSKWDTRDGKFYSFAFSSKMPKLNTNNDEVIEYFINVCQYWVENYNIDGIRLDVANEVSHKFAKMLRTRMKKIKPDLYILGEIWHDSIPWLMGDEFDSVMNYPLTSAIGDFWIDKDMTKGTFEHLINHCYTMYMEQSNDNMFNLLDSHDTERLIHRTKNEDVFYQQLAILFTMQGSPCIYYGTEIIMGGAHDPDCRRCMPWEDIQNNKYDDKINTIRELIKLRTIEPALRSKNISCTNEYSGDRIIEYIKSDDAGREIQIILNGTNEPIDMPDNKEVLFARLCDNGKIKPNGIFIGKLVTLP